MKTKRGAVGMARAVGLAAAMVLVGGVAHAQFPHPLRLDELDGTTGVRFQGVPGSDGAGDGAARTAAGVGDVNGDGYEDFALGAVGKATLDWTVTPPRATTRGRVYVILGHPGPWPATFRLENLDGTNGFIVEGRTEQSHAAEKALSGIGDFNGDGYSDFLIGSLGDGFCELPFDGSVSVVFGRPNFPAVLELSEMDGQDGFSLVSTLVCDRADGRLTGGAGIGDVNGDGFDDIAVTYRNGTPDNPDYPSVEIVYGRAGTWQPVVQMTTLGAGEHTRVLNAGDAGDYYVSTIRVEAASDLDGDGIDDFLIGYPRKDLSPGALHVLFGKVGGFGEAWDLSTLSGNEGYLLRGRGASAESWHFGGAISSGDVDSDGVNELALGAPGAHVGDNDYVGRAFLVTAGRQNESELFVDSLGSGNILDFFGIGYSDSAASSLQFTDFSGDGKLGLSIYTNGANPDIINAGGAYLLSSSTLGAGPPFSLSEVNGENGTLIYGFQFDAGFSTIGTGLDFDGNGGRELLLSSSATNRGEAYLLFGNGSAVTGMVNSYIAPGNAPRRAVGMLGGMHSSIPLSRLWIKFGSGDDGNGNASLMTVTINRHLDGLSNLPGPAASVHWIGEWDRPGWDGANITLKYLGSEVAGLNPARLRLYYSETPDGPWTESQHPLIDTRKKRIGGVVWSKGYYVLIENPLASGDVNKDGGVTPADAEDAFDCSIGACPPGADMDSADICPPGGDGFVTAGDAQGIFQKWLGLTPCE